MKQKLQQLGIIAIISFGFTQSAHAESGNLELLAGNSSTTFDAKVFSPLPHNFGFFLRERASVDYDLHVNSFTETDAIYSLPAGFSLFGGVQAYTPEGIVPRVGGDYFKQFEDFTGYAALTIKTAKDPNAELTLRFSYSPKITKDVSLFFQVEGIGDFGFDGHQFSTERFRLGIQRETYRIGIGADVIQETKLVDEANIGVFVAKKF